MARGSAGSTPRISNRRALHDYSISARLECGIALVGTEVKSLRAGRAQLQDAWAEVDQGQLVLHAAHIDPYEKAALAYSHEPKRDRRLLAHRREIRRLEQETTQRGVTLIPLAIYFKDGRAKVEIGVAHGRHRHDKRQAIRRKEMDQEVRRAMSHRR
jgi:SsrA-binding protein